MQTIKLKVTHYYNQLALSVFIPEDIYSILEDAYLNEEETVSIPKDEYDQMIDDFLDSMKN